MTTEQSDWLDDEASEGGKTFTVPRVDGETGKVVGYDTFPISEREDEVVAKSAFDPANFTEVMLIMQMRLYDLNLALLSAIDPEKAQALVDMHARGQSFAPPPVFAEYEDED